MGLIVAGDEFADRAAETLYTEALLLSDETRAYFDGDGRLERDRLAPVDRVGFACEALKATTRLLQVIAWLAARRQQAVGPVRPIAEAAISGQETLGAMPSAARRLILAGIDLHERTARLAQGTDKGIAVASPARALFQRLERSIHG